MITAFVSVLALAVVNAWPAVSLRYAPRSGRHARPTARKAIQAAIAAARDAETLRLFTEMNEMNRPARFLRTARQMAATGPVGAWAAQLVLCTVTDTLVAARLNAAAIASGRYYLPAAGGR
jgi:hypothetical protein